jgi:arginase
MAEAASLDLPYPEALVVAEDSLPAQTQTLASGLPERPVVLGGCCCSHVGAVQALAAMRGRLGVVWIDAHGDLNTPETSPSGNDWGMPLRMVIDSGAIAPADVALVGARDLDPPEQDFVEASGLHVGPERVGRALDGVEGVYVAIDFDGLDERETRSFMPVPSGLSVDAAADLLRDVAATTAVVGVGFSGLLPDPVNVAPAARLCAALGL